MRVWPSLEDTDLSLRVQQYTISHPTRSIVVSIIQFIINRTAQILMTRPARQHRNADGSATVSEVVPLECHSTFRVFEPWESHRKECPMILVVCGGPHRHPIPLPTKTPQLIRHELTELLARLDLDLPDMTPRRFLRHSALRVHLSTRLPSVVNPMLSDLHPSLSNRDHLRVIIAAVQKEKFPHGTGWKGTCIASFETFSSGLLT